MLCPVWLTRRSTAAGGVPRVGSSPSSGTSGHTCGVGSAWGHADAGEVVPVSSAARNQCGEGLCHPACGLVALRVACELDCAVAQQARHTVGPIPRPGAGSPWCAGSGGSAPAAAAPARAAVGSVASPRHRCSPQPEFLYETKHWELDGSVVHGCPRAMGLADHEHAIVIGPDLTGGERDAQRDRQAIGRPLRADIGWGQVHGHTAQRELCPGVPDANAHLLARFIHRGISASNER